MSYDNAQHSLSIKKDNSASWFLSFDSTICNTILVCGFMVYMDGFINVYIAWDIIWPESGYVLYSDVTAFVNNTIADTKQGL